MSSRPLLILSLAVLCSVAGVARAQPLPCVPDDALAEAAALLLAAGRPIAPDTLRAALHDGASDAPSAHALAVSDADTTRLEAWLGGLAGDADAPLACGEARDHARRVVVVSARGGSLRIADGVARGTLAPGFGAPVLVISDADGALVRVPITVGALASGVSLPDVALPALVQLVATGPRGPRPVAERSVGGPVRARVVLAVEGDAEATVRASLGALRERAEVSPLRENRLLREAAMAHAADVCASGRVAHTLEAERDPEARLHARHVEARRVGEVIARAADALGAARALAQSPSHVATLLDVGFTDAGVGVANDARGRTCVVVLLAEWPRRAP